MPNVICLRHFSLLALIISTVFGCSLSRSTDRSLSDSKDLIVEGDARNIALMISAFNEGPDDLYWSKKSIAQLRRSLKKIKGPAALQSRIRHDVTAEQLLELTTKAAKDVGIDGTLILYVASHGWNTGFATAENGKIRPADLISALRAGRETPLKRLIILLDHCGSGGVVEGLSLNNGPTAVPTGLTPLRDLSKQNAPDPLIGAFVEALTLAGNAASPDTPQLALRNTAEQPMPLYETALYFSAADKQQTTMGATFTEGMAAAIEQSETESEFSIRDFLDATVEKIKETTTHEYVNNDADVIEVPQVAVYRALPNDGFLDEPLFTTDP